MTERITAEEVDQAHGRLFDAIENYAARHPECADAELDTLEKCLADLIALVSAELRAERNEAREWVRRMHHDAQILTCVYCGHAYQPGTASSGSDTLTEHIRVCEKHPLRAAEAEIATLTARVQQAEQELAQRAITVRPDDKAIATITAQARAEMLAQVRAVIDELITEARELGYLPYWLPKLIKQLDALTAPQPETPK